jgi:hypothetical protein
MGKGMDVVSKSKTAEDKYLISELNIKNLFQDYLRLKEESQFSFDKEIVNICLDFEQALTSYQFDDVMRTTIALTQVLGLSQAQAAKLSGLSMKEIREGYINALQTILRIMNGELQAPTKRTSPSQAKTVDEWLEEVIEGTTFIFDTPDDVLTDLLHKMRNHESKETLRQRKEGQPLEGENGIFDIMGYFEYDPERYPFFETSALVENPMRKGEFVTSKASGTDKFRDSYRHNGVSSSDMNTLAKGLQIVGKKKTKGDGENDYETGKGVIYG